MPADVCRALAAHLPPRVILDGELIIWDAGRGSPSFAHLQRRLRAGRAIAREAAACPAHLVSFGLLPGARGTELLDQPLHLRRRRLERLLAGAPPDLPICPQTTDEHTARRWFTEWAGAGVEGLVVKQPTGTYRPADPTSAARTAW